MKTIAVTLLVIMGLLIIWEGFVIYYQLPNYILPAPTTVFATLYQQKVMILHQALPTCIEIVLGFLLGILFGMIAGATIAIYRPFSFWLLPIMIISQAIPTFAIAPLIVIWLGYGLASKIAITILMIFFPIASNFYDGLMQTDPDWLDLAKTMQSKKHRIFWYISVPAALPHLGSGIRIAAVIAPIGAIVGEWVGSSQGLGYLMLNANARLQIDMMFAALIVIVMLALGLYFAVDKLLRIIIWWKGEKTT